MLEVVRSYINDGIGLVQLAAVLIVGFVVLAAWTRTRSITGTVGAMVVGALVIGYVFNAEWLGQRVGQDIVERENGMEVLAGAVLPVTRDQAEALALLAVRTGVTVLWAVAAVLALALVARVTGWRFDLGSPRRAARRGLVRARWRSVARSSGLAVSRDRRTATGLHGGSVLALLSGPLDRAPARSGAVAKPQSIERLPQLSHGRASPDRLTVVYRLTPARGQTVEDVADCAQALADGLHVERVAVRRVGTNRGELVAYLGDPFRVSRVWRSTIMPNAIPWGVDENGATVALRLGEGHALYAAETGGGKSYLLNALLASASIRPDVAIVAVDLKHVELGPWEDRLSGLAVEPAHAAALIAAVAEEVRRRYVRLRQLGLREMTEARADVGPWVLLVIDELSELLDVIDRDELISIGRLARACGVTLVVATQRPDADTVTGKLRDQLALQRWCGHVFAPETARMVVGKGCALDPTTIDRKGVGVLLDQGAPARFARSDVLAEDKAAIPGIIAALVAANAHKRIPLQWLPEAAPVTS